MYNKTLEYYFESLDDKKYIDYKEMILNNMSKMKNELISPLERFEICESLFDKLDLLICYLKNIIRMGYSSKKVENEYDMLLDIESSLEMNKSILIKKIKESEDENIFLEKYPCFDEEKYGARVLAPNFSEMDSKLLISLYNQYVEKISSISVKNSSDFSLSKSLKLIDDKSIKSSLIDILSKQTEVFKNILIDIKKIQKKYIISSHYSLENAIYSFYGIPEDEVTKIKVEFNKFIEIGFCNENIINTINFTFEDAYYIISSITKKLGIKFYNFSQKIFSNYWIDYFDRECKQPGSYTNAIHYTKSGICSTVFLNTYKDVILVAHEMGHIIHAMFVSENNSFFNSDFSSIASETVALVFEILTMSEIIKKYKLNINLKQIRNNKISRLVNELMFENKIFEICDCGTDIDIMKERSSNNDKYITKRDEVFSLYNWFIAVHDFLPTTCLYNFVYLYSEFNAMKIIEDETDYNIIAERLKKLMKYDLLYPYHIVMKKVLSK